MLVLSMKNSEYPELGFFILITERWEKTEDMIQPKEEWLKPMPKSEKEKEGKN